jgi:hypothetical protein
VAREIGGRRRGVGGPLTRQGPQRRLEHHGPRAT